MLNNLFRKMKNAIPMKKYRVMVEIVNNDVVIQKIPMTIDARTKQEVKNRIKKDVTLRAGDIWLDKRKP
jgi:hypothetical protein